MYSSPETLAWNPKLVWPEAARLNWGCTADLGRSPGKDDYFVEVFMEGKQFIHADASSFDAAEKLIYDRAEVHWTCNHPHWQRNGINGYQSCKGCGMSNRCAPEIKTIGNHLEPLSVSELGSLFLGSHLDDDRSSILNNYYRKIVLRAHIAGFPIPGGREEKLRGYQWGAMRKACSQMVLDLLEQNGGCEALLKDALLWEGTVVATTSFWKYERDGETLARAYAAWEYAGKPRLSEDAPAPVMSPFSFTD